MKKKSPYLVLIAFLAIIGAASCEKREYQTIEELDNENITAYINQNNLQVSRYKNTDLYYEVIRPGTGSEISFEKHYPIVFTIKSLDGQYMATDTLERTNRYYDFMGYFPFGSVQAGMPNSPVERQDDLKYVVKDILQRTNGQIRIIVPSRLTGWGRQGNRELGIPPNASMDYVVTVHDNLQSYEEAVIHEAIQRAGYAVEDFTESPNGIYYRIMEQGSGDEITRLDRIQAKYTLRNTAGVEMESSDSIAFSLNGETIEAWSKIIPEINVGGTIRLLTPSRFAYGAAGSNNMAPFMTLDFEVEVLKKY